MLVIRLIRTGKKNTPSFRIVLTEKTAAPQSGKFLEILGFYRPVHKEVGLKAERIKYWLSQGAQVSETVHNLLVDQGLLKGPKIKKRIKPKKKTEEATSGEETETQETSDSKEGTPQEEKEETGTEAKNETGETKETKETQEEKKEDEKKEEGKEDEDKKEENKTEEKEN